MTALHKSLKMTWSPSKIQKAARMDTTHKKALVFVLMLLLSQLDCNAQIVSECCRQPPHSCRLYVLLCRSGSNSMGGTIVEDAAAGILTLGKRDENEYRLQSRLHQLLHSSRNQAAGILTMGRRTTGPTGEQ
ncbi:hypocretin neuropeptide precursor [Nothobranchius furzeri]|nr:orexin [Nothobranchius furzeri]KAF7198787.1 hypocretin (orexin) neuropeptide precursor [Nothobranchius furzeri]